MLCLGASLLRLDIERLARRARLAVPGTEPGGPATLGLTRREAQVLALVAAGHTNRQIGRALYMSEKTAEVHVSHILSKLGVATRGEAGAVAHRAGLVD
jgi:DNA-binding NarL/FixJ family response regulator